jgi:agmatine deiminase
MITGTITQELTAMKRASTIFFPAEWYEQDAVLLTWPHTKTDWAPNLQQVENTYLEIAREILKHEKLIIVCENCQPTKSLFSKSEQSNIHFFRIPSNDTWARDHGPVCTFNEGIPFIHDFRFNGWGNKFDAHLDDLITSKLYEMDAFSRKTMLSPYPGFILEGGSIESDGNQTIMTTSECLLNPNRNKSLSKTEIEEQFKRVLGAVQVLWLDHGNLAGDDTDSHIDILARFCNENTICYIQCNNPEDEHYDALHKMEAQLRTFRNIAGKPYELVPLPMPHPVFNSSGKRMAVTYANFLILNDAVLVPVYSQPEDQPALEILGKIFADRVVTGINCLSLVEQNGSLHCITMQIPKGFLR